MSTESTRATTAPDLDRRLEITQAMLEQERMKNAHLLDVMMSVFNLAPNGEDIKLPDGRVFRFNDPNAAETLNALGRAIHAIPERCAKALASRFRAEGGNTKQECSAENLAAREPAPVARDLLDEEHVADCWRLAAGDWRKFARDIKRRAIHAARGVARDLPAKADENKLGILVAHYWAGTLPDGVMWNVQVTRESLRRALGSDFGNIGAGSGDKANSAPPAPWISVDERLPDDKQRVIIKVTRTNVFDHKNNVKQIYLATYCRGRTTAEVKRDRCMSGNDQQGNNLTPYGWDGDGPLHWFGQDVSHWMPIPAAPSAGSAGTHTKEST